MLRASLNTKCDLKILLIEDEPIPMLVHQMMLTEFGYKPESSENGQQALNLSSTIEYDLILTDIGLPDINGFELTAKIREIECQRKWGKAYIVGLTAYALTEVKEQCFMAGMDEVILKPITAYQLQTVLQTVIAVKGV